MPASYAREEILSQLDECAREFTFPMLDNGYFYLADTRLTAYRNDTQWALIIEVLGASPRTRGHDSLNDCLHCFGNCLKRPAGTANEDFLYPTSDGLDQPTFDEKYGWYVRQDARDIRIREVIAPVAVSLEELAMKSIKLEEPPRVTGAELLRSLVAVHRELLLATEEELRDRLPPNLPQILRLDEWHHPDLVNGELPSASEAFQLIAEVLVSGDVSRYRPTQAPNTHWKNWPDGGRL